MDTLKRAPVQRALLDRAQRSSEGLLCVRRGTREYSAVKRMAAGGLVVRVPIKMRGVQFWTLTEKGHRTP